MELKQALLFKIKDMNFEFRHINETDVNQDYVDGLRKQTEYIENIPVEISISKQKKYIKKLNSSESDTICGLFINEVMVGTSGIQSSPTFLQYIDDPIEYVSTIGIFIFNNKYRGVGMGKILVWAATYLYHKCTLAEWFEAGMAKGNIPSINSFLSCGYLIARDSEESYKVALHISQLVEPDLVSNLEFQEI